MVEQATENRCVGGSIPPLGTTMRMLIVNKILIISLTLFLMGCDSSSKNDYFPDDQGIIWHYKISIGSDYTGKIEEKRLTISNSNRRINAKGTSYSKVFSNGNSFTFLKDVKNNSFTRISASITNGTGLEEPVKKVIFPSIYFESKDWKTLSQLLITKGFQPPLRDFKPSKVFEMNFKVASHNAKIKVKAGAFENCLIIKGYGKTEFTADTRYKPNEVDITSEEWICPGVGSVKEIREEATNSSAFGTRKFYKELISFRK